MNDDIDRNQTDFESLVDQYQQTKAPLGFSSRVMANIEAEKKQRLPAFPRFAYAASVGVIALVSFVVINSIGTNPQAPEQQIAQQDQENVKKQLQSEELPRVAELPQGSQAEPEKQQKNTVVAKVDAPVPAKQKSSTVSISKEERDLFFQPVAETDSASLAELADISNWLADQKDITPPDISDLPDLNEIDSIFDIT